MLLVCERQPSVTRTLRALRGDESTFALAMDSEHLLAKARQCLALEQAAIARTAEALDGHFIEALEAVATTVSAGHKLIFTGVGKNVPIALKLSGTFNSTGVPSAFLDPNQALHGDLGLCTEQDLAILISNSGETGDLIRLLPFLKRLGVKTLALTSGTDSSLARHCDLVLPYYVDQEACPLNLAPTASTTAALALGDALAMVYLERRGLTREDFARYHPAGSLGQALLLKVSEIMRTGERFACQPESVTVQDALLAITRAKCGIIALTDNEGRLAGVFSDGDFRRAIVKDPAALSRPVKSLMTPRPITIRADVLAVEALKVFEKQTINDLIVVDAENRPVGLIDGQDLPRLRVV